MNMHLNIEDLEILFVLSTEKSLSQAAGKLGYTQQALSYRLKKIEKQLHKPLFSRTAQGLEILPEANPVFKAIADILCRLKTIQQTFADFSPDGQSQSIPLYMSTALEILELLSQSFAALFCHYPHIRWSVSPHGDEKRLSEHLKANPHGIALGCSPITQHGFVSRCFFEAPVLLVGTPAWQDREPTLINIQAQSPYSLNQIISDQQQRALHTLANQYVSEAITVDNHRVAQNLVLSGQGVFFAHALTVQNHLKTGDLVILETFSEHICKGYFSAHESHWYAHSPYTLLWETLQKTVQTSLISVGQP